MYFTWLHPYRLQEKCREMIRLRILHFFIVPVLRLHMRFPDFHISCIYAFRIFTFLWNSRQNSVPYSHSHADFHPASASSVISLHSRITFVNQGTVPSAEWLPHPAMENRFAIGRMPAGAMLPYGLCSECTDLRER